MTGGAGFIGSHLVDALLAAGHAVRVFDNLEPQVHGSLRERGEWPDYLAADCEKVLGDVRDRDALRRAIEGVDVVFHKASVLGIGRSMDEVQHYVDVNVGGTAVLLDVLTNERYRVRKLILSSSMSVYGEGSCCCTEHGVVHPQARSDEQLARQAWELLCPLCGQPVVPVPTDEDAPLFPASIYALTKKNQEELCLLAGRACGLPVVVLRYFVTYGSRQALTNPYTGVAAIFSSRLLRGERPVVFEDGLQSRDFVHVSDIVQADLLAMGRDEMNYGVFNVGTGRPITVLDVARALAQLLGQRVEPEVVYRFRPGDIRHCFADVSRIWAFGYRPRVCFEDGIAELVDWVREQEMPNRPAALDLPG